MLPRETRPRGDRFGGGDISVAANNAERAARCCAARPATQNSALLGGRSSNLTLIPQAYTQGVPSTEDLIAAGSVDWLVTSSAEVACAQINFGIQPMYTFQSNRLFNGSDYSGAVFIARAADNSTVRTRAAGWGLGARSGAHRDATLRRAAPRRCR